MRTYYVYIMAGQYRSLYTGMTNDLERRVYEHKHKLAPGFTSKYNITRLVYIETFNHARDAIRREKQIKGWLRAKKVALIVSDNPSWRDLSEGWFGKE
ncbi:MAG TPA: GIY-YIG nuclease family protein [Terriglobia bacterium]|nr:GIY-YIG nuclease family protein [Terriglobia bacterium]